MSYLGPLTRYLGLQFEQTPDGMVLHQTDFANSILETYGLAHCNSTKTPLPPGFTTRKDTRIETVDPKLFRSIIGKLMFLTNTRPDISFAVNLLSRYSSAPQQAHLRGVKQILRYIKGTSNLGLFYKRKSGLELTGYTDADWGGNLNQRKSTRAYLFTINGTPITWCTKKQTCVALSSTESEYRSLVEATKEAIWIKGLYSELGLRKKGPIHIFCDNQSAIKISKNPMYHSKTKHFEIHLNYVQDMVDNRKVAVDYTATDQQPADILTKALARIKFSRCRDLLNLHFS
jgi:hypothetical protein